LKENFVATSISRTGKSQTPRASRSIHMLNGALSTPADSRNRDQIIVRMAILFMIAYCAGTLALGQGALLRVSYPAVSGLVAVTLFKLDRPMFLGFVLWNWFLTPFLRRLVDHQAGFVEPSPILVAPYLITAICVFGIYPKLRTTPREKLLPFGLCLAAVAYGSLSGLLQNGPHGLLPELLHWGIPILLGLYLALETDHYEAHQRVIKRGFLWGVAIMGAYGVYQFIAPPSWDTEWLILLNSGEGSWGTPEPFGMRVFSTLNACGPFSFVMLAGLLTLMTVRSWVAIPSGALGLASLLLTQGRTACIGLVVALLAMLARSDNKFRLRVIVGACVLTALVVPLFSIPEAAEQLETRFNTFTTLSHDESAQGRQMGFDMGVRRIAMNPLGVGIGFPWDGLGFGDDFSLRDNGLIEIMLLMGWFAGPVYLIGLAIILSRLLRVYRARTDLFSCAACCVALGFTSVLLLGSVTMSVIGIFLWMFMGVALGSPGWHSELGVSPAPLKSWRSMEAQEPLPTRSLWPKTVVHLRETN
jgi:hypothetical protein